MARPRPPDIVVLQELKAPQDNFPERDIAPLGYEEIRDGQSRWNGVALLSRMAPPHETRRSRPGDLQDDQSRYIEAAVDGILSCAGSTVSTITSRR